MKRIILGCTPVGRLRVRVSITTVEDDQRKLRRVGAITLDLVDWRTFETLLSLVPGATVSYSGDSMIRLRVERLHTEGGALDR